MRSGKSYSARFGVGVSLWALAASSTLAGAAFAQETAQDQNEEQERVFDAIVVTADKVERSIQDVPIAVSAFSQENLKVKGIEEAIDLQLTIPNLSFSRTNFTNANITIRGVGAPITGVGTDTGVGVHVNGVPLTSTRVFEAELFDVERVEVLRGPQGTVFGRNATGGVINIISAKPTDEWGGEAQLTGGSFGTFQAQGHLNAPIFGEYGGVRASGFYTRRDGFTENLATGNDIDGRELFSVRGTVSLFPTENTEIFFHASYFQEDDNRARIQKLLCVPDPRPFPFSQGCLPEDLSGPEGFGVPNATASLANTPAFLAPTLVTLLTGGAIPSAAIPTLFPFGTNGFAGAVNPPDFRVVNSTFEPEYFADELLFTLDFKHDFGPFTLTSLTSYQDTQVTSRADFFGIAPSVTFNPNQFIALGPPGTPLFQQVTDASGVFTVPALFQGNPAFAAPVGNGLTAFDQSNGGGRQITTELRINTELDGPVNFNIGGLYINSRTDNNFIVSSNALEFFGVIGNAVASAGSLAVGGPLVITPDLFFVNFETPNIELDAFAGFAEAYWAVTDTITITTGIRYTNDRKFIETRTTIPFDAFTGVADPFTPLGTRFDAVTGRFTVDWKPDFSFTDDTLFYASYSRGFKGGGPNNAAGLSSAVVDVPEVFLNEIVNAYEVGTKNVFGGGRHTLNFTGFFYDYSNFQLTRIIAQAPLTDNIDASVWGVELETVFRPFDGWQFDLNAAYLGSSAREPAFPIFDPINPTAGDPNFTVLKDGLTASNCVTGTAGLAAFQAALGPSAAGLLPFVCTFLPGPTPTRLLPTLLTGALVPQFLAAGLPLATAQAQAAAQAGALTALVPIQDGIPIDISGNELPGAPNFNISFGTSYSWKLGAGWQATVRSDYYYQTSSFSRIFNTASDRIPGFDQWNLSARLDNEDWGVSITAFARNVFNENSITGLFLQDQSAALLTNAFTLDPRIVGVSVSKTF